MITLPDLSTEVGQKQLTSLFRYAEVGHCVNSVTHDVNNYLGAILAYAELIQLEGGQTEEANRMLNEIIEGVTKCSNLLTAMTEVARKERPGGTVTDLKRLVTEVCDLRSYNLKTARIKIETCFTDAPVTLTADRPQLKMAIMYLITNAVEALENEDRRILRISIGVTESEVEVVLWNSGPPIPEEDTEQIFEPGYTTKGEQHLGWGLVAARRVAELHEGTLCYLSDIGFVMRLPMENSLETMHVGLG